MVATRAIREVVGASPTGFSYGHTFSGYPLGCAVGCAVIDTIEEEGLVEAAAAKGDRLSAGLHELARLHPLVHEVRGRGLLQGIELRHPITGDRFEAFERVSSRLVAAARDNGVMIYSCPTPVVNRHMDAVLLAPPLIISEDEIAEALQVLDAALGSIESSL
jgi:adenosylmethionine-8-amino-7-oxononanoate aminotransferase